MILKLLYKPARYQPLVEVQELAVSTEGVVGAAPALPLRHVLIVPRSTIDEFRLAPGDLRENVIVDDVGIGPLHALPSGTVLGLGDVHVRLTVHCEPCGRLRGVVETRRVEHRRGYLGTFLNAGVLRVGEGIASLGVRYEAVPYDLRERLAWFLARQPGPVEVTRLVHEVGLSLSYCRAIPNLLRNRPDLATKVTFRGRVLRRARSSVGGRPAAPRGRGRRAPSGPQCPETSATSVEFIDGSFVVYLQDGRSFAVPLETIARLIEADPAERGRWELADGGRRIRWPNLDLEVTVASLPGLPE